MGKAEELQNGAFLACGDYPYPLRRDDEPLEDSPEMNEEDAQAKLEQMKAALLERMRAKHPDNK